MLNFRGLCEAASKWIEKEIEREEEAFARHGKKVAFCRCDGVKEPRRRAALTVATEEKPAKHVKAVCVLQASRIDTAVESRGETSSRSTYLNIGLSYVGRL